MTDIICVGCGLNFRGEGRRKYCSKACYTGNIAGANNPNFRHGNATANKHCKRCGDQFCGTASRVYCNETCSNKAPNAMFKHGRAARRLKHCEWCNAEFYGMLSSRCCSRACSGRLKLRERFDGKNGEDWRKRYSELTSGTKNPNWRGGRSIMPYTIGWKRSVKAKARERDSNICVLCKTGPTKTDPLVVHHVDESKTNHDLDNLMTLCRPCHVRLHHRKISLLCALYKPKAPAPSDEIYASA